MMMMIGELSWSHIRSDEKMEGVLEKKRAIRRKLQGHRERETDRDRQTETDRDKERQRETERDRERQREAE